jgi:hypothetical protein
MKVYRGAELKVSLVVKLGTTRSVHVTLWGEGMRTVLFRKLGGSTADLDEVAKRIFCPSW